VETVWTAARRVSSLNGATNAKFTRRVESCDAHAAMAQRRVELLTK
jgi:hypothetical protein